MMSHEPKLTIEKRRTSHELLNDSGPFTSLLREVVLFAKKSGASDIHIEPSEVGVEIRVRINGELETFRLVSIEHKVSVVFEAKRLFGLAIGVSGKPQDGRVALPELKLDLRVSLLPTFYGEKIVMRLLDLDNSLDLSALGYTQEELSVFRSAIMHEDGLVVISGPTGSGKTRALYALLRQLDASKLNIVTVEDPIEYRIPGVNQVQVSSKLGFSDALRSILRQDPDVILVGEIRDKETAILCFQAAATGHLVLSTVHANGAVEVISRLENLGVDSLDIKSSLRVSLAQRLEQRLCRKCSLRPDSSFVPKTKVSLDGLLTRNLDGCSECKSGLVGRIPILEWASLDESGKPFVKRSLSEARIQRVLCGEIDFREVNL
jgi:type IV pilus assembly protein PilB